MPGIQDFLDYFLSPKKTGYDVPKTFTYAIVLILAVFLIFKILKKVKVRIDKRLAIAISPYIIFGSSLRVLEDLGLINSYFIITPGIYLFIFLICFSVLLISLLIEKRKGIPYFKTSFTFGLILVALILPQFKVVNFRGLLLVVISFIPWVLLFWKILKKWDLTNRMVSLFQMFDASTTFVAVNFFRYSEQHIFPTYLINIFGPISFLFAKLIVIVSILILIDRFSKDKEFNNYLKLIIGILGAATGTRDFIRLLV